MEPSIEVPTPEALADLVACCKRINRYATHLSAAEETRVAALAAGVLAMRTVLALRVEAPERLPARQQRITHWRLTGDELDAIATPPIQRLDGVLVVDEHEQIKLLLQRTWRGVWRNVVLWRDGVNGLSARDLLEYLARIAALAQSRVPGAVEVLVERSRAIETTRSLGPDGPRSRAD